MKSILFVVSCLFAVAAAAQNADRLPESSARSADLPIVLIVPFPAGGSADRIGKFVAAAFSDSLKRSVSIRNMTSGVGIEALTAVAKPIAGEIRLGYATNTQIVAGTFQTKGAPFNPSDDFEWIGIVGTYGNAVVFGPQEPAASFDQWLQVVPKLSRPVRVGAGAAGSMSALAAQFLAEALAGRVEIVNFAAADAGYTALRNVEIDVYVDGLPNALDEAPLIGARILAITSKDRAGILPGVPSFGERWPGEDFSSFAAIVVASKETEVIRSRLKSGWYGVNRAGTARRELAAIGVNYLGLDLDAAPAFMEREFLRHAKLLTRFEPAK
jgi:tripartite-type tricarboxylate transporter receptor subunit TctC